MNAALNVLPLKSDDHFVVEQQLRTLAVLDRAQRDADGFMRGFAKFMAAVPITLAALKVVGMLLVSDQSSAFIHRCANTPWWVVILMTVCGGFLAFMGWKSARGASPALDHLRSNPSDPLIEVAVLIEVRRGFRELQLSFETRQGKIVNQTVFDNFETETLAAIQRAGIRTRAWS